MSVIHDATDAQVEVFSTCPQSSGECWETYRQHVIDVARWSEGFGCKGILVYTDNSLVDPLPSRASHHRAHKQPLSASGFSADLHASLRHSQDGRNACHVVPPKECEAETPVNGLKSGIRVEIIMRGNEDQAWEIAEQGFPEEGKQWYFGMKAHVGVDSKTKLIHTAVATAANVADVTVLPDLLHGEETRVWGDQAYRGRPK